MPRLALVGIPIAILITLMLGCSPGTRTKVDDAMKNSTVVDSPHSTNAPRKYVGIQFSNMSVHPSVARIVSGGSAGWLNYGEYLGIISFPESVADQFTCNELRPNFSRGNGKVQSIPVDRTGDDDVTLPCPLKPGTYDYEILLVQGVGGIYNPLRTLKAQIVVEAPSAP